MTASHRTERRIKAPLRHLARNAVAYLALFFALAGTSLAAGKLLTGADILDDSLTGDDIVETSLAKVRAAADSDRLGGIPADEFVKAGGNAAGDLSGTYPNPDLAEGAAAQNIWGKNQWAPAGTTQRGLVFVSNPIDVWGGVLLQVLPSVSISYPVPLAPGASVEDHIIRDGDAPPEGCGGSYAEPTAEPGHICVFYKGSQWEELVDDTPGDEDARYGRILLVHDLDPNDEISAEVRAVWAMTAPREQRR